jgi:saccharopine dehydrogenase-like NADP-dependent oxidoreductase
MSRVLIIGAGGIGGMVAQKCAQAPEVFTDICLAGRTLPARRRRIRMAQVDTRKPRDLVRLIESFRPDIVINAAPPAQAPAIMQACLKTGVDYLDTDGRELPDQAGPAGPRPGALDRKFRRRGIMGLRGCGFDPGVTNLFCAYARKHYFDRIHAVQIMTGKGRAPAAPGKSGPRQPGAGCLIDGVRKGKRRTVYVYRVRRRAAGRSGVQARAAYAAAVPAMIGALLMATGTWAGEGVFNVEHFDPDPFMKELNRRGLPWAARPCDPRSALWTV